jgi:hypothetical protein
MLFVVFLFLFFVFSNGLFLSSLCGCAMDAEAYTAHTITKVDKKETSMI